MQSAINLCELVISGYHLTRDFEWPGIDLNFLKTNFCLNILNLENGYTREKAKLSLVCLKCDIGRTEKNVGYEQHEPPSFEPNWFLWSSEWQYYW
jgi:hypothetical protein